MTCSMPDITLLDKTLDFQSLIYFQTKKNFKKSIP